MRTLLVDLIATKAPPRPACFESDEEWKRWLVAAHAAGEAVVRRVDVGQKTKHRRTYFEVLPADRIDICKDCTVLRRDRMLGENRCHPPAAHALLQALKAGATDTALGRMLAARPVDAPLLRLLYDVMQSDIKRARQAAAAAVKNERARQHVRQAWARHLSDVASERAEPMSKAAFAAVAAAAMAKDRAWDGPDGRPFRVAPRRIAEHWLMTPPVAGNVRTLPATRSTATPAADQVPAQRRREDHGEPEAHGQQGQGRQGQGQGLPAKGPLKAEAGGFGCPPDED